VEVREDEDGHVVMRAKEMETAPTRSVTIKLPIKKREDVQVVCVKSPAATVVIPEIEFEIGNDGKRAIDTIYNHIGQAIFQLEYYASHVEATKKEAINATLEQLRKCLDVDFEWTWVVNDPSGMSEMSDHEALEVTYQDLQ
jgi:mediator of RNA polymerase II transcription subunit 31